MLKQVQFRGCDERGNIFCLPLIQQGMEKTAAGIEMRSKLHPKIQDFVGFVRPTPSGIYILVNALGAGEYWGSNVNGDLFPEKALIHSPPNWDQLSTEQMQQIGSTWPFGYPTFMNAYPYKHHVNKDPSRAFGRVELAVWNPKMHRVELVVYLDRALCMQFDAYDIIERIERGEFPDVSMGCRVPFDVCTICGNQSKTRNDYCEHAAMMMNRILPDGRKVAVRNDTPRFFDISFVFIGADKTAKVMAKLAQQGNQVCLGDYCTIPRSSAEVGEVFSKEAAVIGHISGPSGSGKTTLLNKLQAKHPGLVAKDLDEFDEEAENKLFPGTPKKSYSKEMVGQLATERQKILDAFLNQYKNSQILLGGHHVESGTALKIPTDKKYLLNTGPLKSAWRAYRRSQSEKPAHRRSLTELPSDWKEARDVTKELKGLGYQPSQDHEIEIDIDKYLAKLHERRPDLAKIANDPLKKSIRIAGMDIGIEWLRGETRKYKSGFSQEMKADYGYIKRTEDADGEELDVYVGPNRNSDKVFIIKQLKDDGSFDEHKVMLGYDSYEDAKSSYLDHMPSKRFKSMEGMGIEEFKKTNLKEAKELAKEAGSCGCHGLGDDCGGSTEKLGHLLFPGVSLKTASHNKFSEIIKSVPAGPFTKETLPRLEQTERSIPPETLNLMARQGLGPAVSTPGMMGMVLKPIEFQRIVLMRMGEPGLADELDAKNMTFSPTQEIDESIPVDEGLSDPRIQELLQLMGLFRDRTIAEPALHKRVQEAARPAGMPAGTTGADPVLNKIAAAYNGYRRSLIKKASQIERTLELDPQLRAELFGESMVKAFAGGIEKRATVSVLGPDSLAYLVGAFHENRGFHTSDPGIVAPLAHVGGFAEVSV